MTLARALVILVLLGAFAGAFLSYGKPTPLWAVAASVVAGAVGLLGTMRRSPASKRKLLR